MLLIATTLVSSTSVKKEHIEPALYSADVPIWKEGDSWTFNERYAEFGYRADGTRVIAWYHNCTSTYTVMDDTGDTYTVKLTSENNEGSLMWGRYRVRYTPFTTLTQELEHRKTDLAYTSWTHQEKGFVFWLLGRIGFPFPAYLSVLVEASFTPAEGLIPFPLTAGTNGTFPSYTVTGNQIRSLYFGLIKMADADFSYDVSAQDYECTNTSISVPAGDYDAYNISSDVGGAQNYSYLYYVPEVGFYAKISSHLELEDTGEPYLNYEHELVSTTYTP
jgi:hypothetical protein